MPRAFFAFLILALLAGLAGPQLAAGEPPGAWRYTDLRLLDPPDAPAPAADIAAVYLRRAAHGLQIRVEMLEVAPAAGADLRLELDTPGGGVRVLLPVRGPFQVLDPAGRPLAGASLRVMRDSALDTIEINLQAPGLAGPLPGLALRAFTSLPGETISADSTAAAYLHAAPPPRLKVALAFWNTYPAFTPAQAARRWDGAHTGPHGVRHGLFNLLRTARARHMPLILLDLKSPASLAGLEYGGNPNLLRSMAQMGLLGLPDVQTAPPGSTNAAVRLSRETALAMDLPAGRAMTSAAGAPVPGGYLAVYTRSPADLPACPGSEPPMLLPAHQAGTHVFDFDLCTDPDQVNHAGLSLPARSGLLRAAAAATPGALWLGGDLARSAWGEPGSARAAFAYLASRPWVEVLDETRLLQLPASSGGRRITFDYTQDADPSAAFLERSLLAGLFAPLSPHPAELDDLRHAYLSQAEALLQAQRWAQAPAAQAACETDFNGDGLTDCTLASENVFTALDGLSSGLTHLFVLQNGELHQLVGPSSQMVVGLGPPETWQQAMGRWIDPQTIAAGLELVGGNDIHTIGIEDGGIRLATAGIWRRYRLVENGLEISGGGATPPNRLRLPILADPWLRFQPGWAEAYRSVEIPGGWRWQAGINAWVAIRGSQPLSLSAFNETQALMGRSEDPNRDYPAGHFLPFPLVVVEFIETGDWRLEITWESGS